MKKLFKIAPLFILCFFVLSGCTSSIVKLMENNIAEVRENLYAGENKEIKATLSSGMREKDYVINGYATELIEFGVLTFNVVVPSEEFESFEPMFVLFVGTKRYDGVLEKNPFDGSYVADLKKIISTNDVIKAKIMCGKFVSEVELNNITENWDVSHKKAIKIAGKKLSEQIEALKENGNLAAEIYVKIVADTEINKGTYYWYVNVVSRKGRTYAVIINPENGEILAEKTF